MKIFLIEDSQFKIDKIVTFLSSNSFEDITIKKSYNAAINEISSEKFDYDLILLDISIPVFDVIENPSEFMPSGGKSIFNQIYMNELCSKVIVITLYKSFDDGSIMESLHTQFKDDYPDNYLGYIIFNNDDIKWQAELLKKIKVLNNG